MTPFVEFQQQIIGILFRLQKLNPEYLRELAWRCKGMKIGLSPDDRAFLVSQGLRFPEFPKEHWDTEKECLEIIQEQIDDTGLEVKIRNMLGSALYDYGPPVGLQEYMKNGGGHPNILRTKHLAQPATLKVGDVLGNGDHVLSSPREGGNGSVLLHLTGGFQGHWISVPARIPIALLHEKS